MQVIETYIKGKTKSEEDCEDKIFVSEHFAAIIDGATSKSSRTYNNMSTGRACAELISHALTKLPENATAQEAVKYLTSVISDFYEEEGVKAYLETNPVERATASIVIFSRMRQEIWMVGDCQCLIDGEYIDNRMILEKVLSDVRALYLETEVLTGKTIESMLEDDPGRSYILPLLKRQSLFQNSSGSDFCFGAIDGFDVPPDKIKVVKLSQPRTVILASDGYPRLFQTLTESEDYLKKTIEADPLCFRLFKSTKGLRTGNFSFDDRSYLKIGF